MVLAAVAPVVSGELTRILRVVGPEPVRRRRQKAVVPSNGNVD
jgi:hypothetical protein